LRPFYETSSQRSNEELIARYVATRWDCKIIRMKTAFPVDYMLKRPSGSAFAEIKHRDYSMDAMDRMGGVFISLLKWGTAKNLCEVAACPLIVIVRDGLGGTYWYRTSDFSHDGIGYGGRTDRNDDQDCEPVVLLRKDRFRKL
jgi:hypothetical protein